MNWILRVGNWDSSNYSGISITNGANENGDAQVLQFFFCLDVMKRKGHHINIQECNYIL